MPPEPMRHDSAATTTSPRVPAGLRLPDLGGRSRAYEDLPWQRTKLSVRGEDPADRTVWAVTCFATRAGYRRRGISRALAAAAVDFARERGARAVEAYPMITEPGVEITWGETHVGTRSIFETAGMTEVLRASLRRVVMRIDFQPVDVHRPPRPRRSRKGDANECADHAGPLADVVTPDRGRRDHRCGCDEGRRGARGRSVAMTSLLDDAFAHHIWATERLLDACATLTSEQLATPTPGTYGPIMATLAHLVSSDRWYLSFFREQPAPIVEEANVSLADLREAIAANGAAWQVLLASDPDPEADLVERGDGWEFHQPAGLRLAQAIHHGTDHRSQVCTALTSHGIEPPEIDLWAYGEATGRTRAIEG